MEKVDRAKRVTFNRFGGPIRQIKVGDAYYRLQPNWLLPYQQGTTFQVSKALFLLRFGVPFWALAFVFDGPPHISLKFIEIVGKTGRPEPYNFGVVV